MLYRFLRTIHEGDVQSSMEVARILNISPDMTLQIARELASKGYLQETGADCDTPRMTCSDCPVSDGCHVTARYWFLTEKGRTALSRAATKNLFT
jgi:hypothetical protein